MASTQQLLLGEGAGGAEKNYIESVFSTYLYTGTGAAQTITNNIDLSTKGGLVWTKRREAIDSHRIFDTQRGENSLSSDSTAAQTSTSGVGITSFNTNGFSLGVWAEVNASGANYASWTFREQPKFFDVVTFTGDGTSNRAIAHAIGGTVGCVIVKRTDSTGEWMVYHQGSNSGNHFLNQAVGGLGSNAYINGVSSSTFTVSSVANTNGASYTAYVFAHNAGGFGLTGAENVITCGSYTGNGTADGSKEINLGFEPQFLIVHGTGDWVMADNMRCMNYGGANTWQLKTNDATAEGGSGDFFRPTATGFKIFSSGANANASGTNYIYIAIRRGPMKVPTDATKVFAPIARTGTSAVAAVTTGFPVDMVLIKNRPNTYGYGTLAYDKLRGALKYLFTNTTASEASAAGTVTGFTNTGFALGNDGGSGYTNYSPSTYINWAFQRAPSFFDEVCYTGTGTAMTVSHNLGVAPELMIVKSRSTADAWPVYSAATGNSQNLFLNQTDAAASRIYWNNTTPTASVFSLGNSSVVSNSGVTYVAYLFATCAGVSKVGSYTGTGTTQQIDCGFAAGARFVLVKATSTTGNWIVVDTARGLVSGNDPTLLLNSTAAEVTTTDWFDPYSAGFELSSAGGNLANTNGVSYIFLAIA